MLFGHDSPQQVLDHDGVLVLSTTVVGVQVYCFLAQPIMHKEVVEHGYNGNGALPHVNSLVDQVVHLSGEGLTTHTEDGTLPGSQKVHWAGLERVVGVEYLLGHVETVVGMNGSVVGWPFAAGGGGEKVPSVEKWARIDDLAFSRASLYTNLSVVTATR